MKKKIWQAYQTKWIDDLGVKLWRHNLTQVLNKSFVMPLLGKRMVSMTNSLVIHFLLHSNKRQKFSFTRKLILRITNFPLEWWEYKLEWSEWKNKAMYVRLSVCPSVRPSVHLSVCPSVRLYVRRFLFKSRIHVNSSRFKLIQVDQVDWLFRCVHSSL